LTGNISGESDDRFAHGFAQPPPDPDLARVLDAWPTLPAPIRRAILALVESDK
jgi:hypothetical protein